MITRGHYIGEVIDELAAIGQQVAMRNRLGLTDLTVYAENVFRDVLNILSSCNLQNLNKDRSNEPGLDLGDEAANLGVQVTSRADSAKVNSTLQKITADQAAKFTDVVVLVVGKKQGSYTLDPDLCAKCNFDSSKIWDLDNLARMTVSLQIEPLQKLHHLVRSEVARLKVELEVPNEEGKYPTSGYDKWEIRVKPKVGDGQAFITYWQNEHDVELNDREVEDVKKALRRLGRRLSRLPRITREFLVMLYERRDSARSRRFTDAQWAHVLYSKVKREYQGGDLEGEFDILEHEEFVRIDGEDPYESGPPEIGLHITTDSDDLAAGFLEFVKDRDLSFRTVIGEADLSAF
jgi:hypothetical protein